MATAVALLALLAILVVVPPILSGLGRPSNLSWLVYVIVLLVVLFALLVPSVIWPRSIIAASVSALPVGFLLLLGMGVEPMSWPRVHPPRGDSVPGSTFGSNNSRHRRPSVPRPVDPAQLAARHPDWLPCGGTDGVPQRDPVLSTPADRGRTLVVSVQRLGLLVPAGDINDHVRVSGHVIEVELAATTQLDHGEAGHRLACGPVEVGRQRPWTLVGPRGQVARC
jgi:hypothetical protein